MTPRTPARALRLRTSSPVRARPELQTDVDGLASDLEQLDLSVSSADPLADASVDDEGDSIESASGAWSASASGAGAEDAGEDEEDEGEEIYSFSEILDEEVGTPAAGDGDEGDADADGEDEEISEEEEDDDEESEEESDSRDSADAYSDVEDDSLADASLADASYALASSADSSGSEFDDLSSSSSSSSSSSCNKSSDGDEEEKAAERREELEELARCAVHSRRTALLEAAADGFAPRRVRTVTRAAEALRALVNVLGELNDAPVNADRLLEYLSAPERRARLLDAQGEFVFDGRRDVLNKYLALIKYSAPAGATQIEEALKEERVVSDDGSVDLRLLVRVLKAA